jgi:undecaprenyl pyrophosphate phosphatase UppP
MSNNLLLYILYGIVAGFSEYSPVSASSHQALFPMLLRFDSAWPVLRFFVHAGALAAYVVIYWKRLNHLSREMQFVTLSTGRKKRPRDMDAILDISLAMMALIPTLIGAVCAAFLSGNNVNLFIQAILLIIGATLIYIPDYIPGGDRKTGAMAPLEGFILGLCAGCSIIPGISKVGLMLAFGILRKGERSYILDLALLISGLMVAENLLLDLISIFVTGFSGFSILRLFGCLLAGAASFGGGIGAIQMMRYLSVKTGFSGFAFYGWGLGLFSFILYLMT